MSKLAAKQRNALPKAEFGLPAQRKYPMPDKAHAANAKARASQQVGKTISAGQQQTIDAKANKVLHKAKGGLVCAHKSVATKLCNGGKVG